MKCNSCGGTKYKEIRDHVRYNIPIKVYKCLLCGLQFLGEHKKLDYDEEYRKKYTPIIGKSCTSEELFDIYSRFQKYKINDLKTHINIKNKRLLDVGCSSGYFVKEIKPHVKQAFGLEIRKSDVTFAREKGLDVRERLSDYPTDFFDVVTIFHTLEHMEDPRGFLKSLKPYLAKHGRVYISVPNLDDIMLTGYAVPEFAEWWYEQPHLYYFSASSLFFMLNQENYSGSMHTQQRVNLLNHMHWLFAKKQQMTEEERMSIPKVSDDEYINMVFIEMDIFYKKYLEKNFLADNLVFVGESREVVQK